MQNTKESWDLLSKAYENSPIASGRTEESLTPTAKDIIKKLKLSKKTSLLEVGCGNAFLLSILRTSVKSIAGTDFSEEQIKQAKKLLKAKFYVSEANKLPFKDNSFDRVLCYSVFHYFPSYEYAKQTIKELIRVCKPSGLILIGDIPSKQHKSKFLNPSHKNPLLTPLKIIKFRLTLFKNKITKNKSSFVATWLWFNLQELAAYVFSLGYAAEILPQPPTLDSCKYRFDILIEKD